MEMVVAGWLEELHALLKINLWVVVEKSSDILVKLLIINFEGGLVRHGNVKWTVLFSPPIDRELIFEEKKHIYL